MVDEATSIWLQFATFMDGISLWVWFVISLVVLVACVRWMGNLLIQSHNAYDEARLTDLKTISEEIQSVRQAIVEIDKSLWRLARGKSQATQVETPRDTQP